MYQGKLPQQQKFPQDIQCVVAPNNEGKGAIFISNIEAAENPATLKAHRIGAVITAIRGKNLSDVIPRQLEYLYVPAVDSQKFDIKYYFKTTNQFLSEQLKRTNVLVHCMAGVSRSVTLVIAYLMFTKGYSYRTAYQAIKQKRSIICPNEYFLVQLQEYEKQLRDQNTSTNKQNKENVNKQSKNQKKNPPISLPHDNYYQKLSYDIALKQNILRVFNNQTQHPTEIPERPAFSNLHNIQIK